MEGTGVENVGWSGGRGDCAIYAMFQKAIHEQSWTKALNIFFIADILTLTNEINYDIEPETFWTINYAILKLMP